MTQSDTLKARAELEDIHGVGSRSCSSCLHWYEDVDKGEHCATCRNQDGWQTCKDVK